MADTIVVYNLRSHLSLFDHEHYGLRIFSITLPRPSISRHDIRQYTYGAERSGDMVGRMVTMIVNSGDISEGERRV